MIQQVRKAAVLGAGVMGAAIAAHLANVGIPVLLLDIVPTELTAEEAKKGLTLTDKAVRNRFAARGLSAATKAKPASFYDAADARLITIGNFEDDLSKLKDCDWVIEAVVENLDIKKQLFASVAGAIGPDTVLSSNTSGISIASMSEDLSAEVRRRFLGTHFFNPPRYMELLEVIPGPDTDPELLTFFRRFGERVLGKGVVEAKDTPNFIANRIGTYGLLITLAAMKKYGLGVDEVDEITGRAMGRPKSATFRTLDLVGLDTFVHVARNVGASVEPAWEKEAFQVPDYILQMLERRWIGEKAGQGFFKRMKSATGSEILAIDLETLEYRDRRKVKSPALDAAKRGKTQSEKLRALVGGKDAASLFAWDIIKQTLLYTATIQDEIADDITAVDDAMRWGFNWDLGPYQLWDALGVEDTAARMRNEGETIPPFVETMLSEGKTSFYETTDGSVSFYVAKEGYRTREEAPEVISLAKLKAQGKLVRGNKGASLVDIGDGVLCLEFHSLKQAIGPDVVQMIDASIQELSKNWDALVIANEAKNFCVGANITMMLMSAQDEDWGTIDAEVRQLQSTLYRLKYSSKPVVAAPHGMALGGGLEVCFPANHIQSAAEAYVGLVEAGIGLIPGGGGNKEVLIRLTEGVPDNVDERLDAFVAKAFENVALAKVSTSGKNAKQLGYLRDSDGITVNRHHLLYDAKMTALGLARAGFRQPAEKPIRVVGEGGAALLKIGVYGMKQSGYISDHDVKIAHQLIRVMTGGNVPRGTAVSEQYLLDLEREAFLSLIGEPKTQQRMQYMLTKGKPLRN